jgi:CRP-like cAMP-binding protein
MSEVVPAENQLLASLPPDEYQRIRPHLTEVSVSLGEVLFRPEETIAYAHFPTTSIVSLRTELSRGPGLEVGLVGREGLVGTSVVLGGTENKVATVQGAGYARRIEAGVLRHEFHRGGVLQQAVLRYLHALMSQISQTVVCNMWHPLPGRLARWLLMYHDRLGQDEFSLTPEFMAAMMGIKQSEVAEVAAELEKRKFIRYEDGRFTIIDRNGLEEFVCECYFLIKDKYAEFLL